MEKIEHRIVATNGINMHVASIGTGPVILFLHGFPELWYSWRHQLLHLSALGYRCIAPDLRGYGNTDAPASESEYTALHIVGDLVGLLDALGIEQVFLVGQDWGALYAWQFCIFRPDRIKAMVNTLRFFPRDPQLNPVEAMRVAFGDNYYFCRFQPLGGLWPKQLLEYYSLSLYLSVPGEAEADFAEVDTARLLTKFFSSVFGPNPHIIPKEIGFRGLQDPPSLPSWLSEEDINYFATKFNQTGFTGGLNYHRAAIPTWELTAPWTGVQIKVPVKLITGDQDIVYNIPGNKEYIHNGGLKKDVPLLQEVVVLPGVAHFINQEKPEELSKHIYDFFKKF